MDKFETIFNKITQLAWKNGIEISEIGVSPKVYRELKKNTHYEDGSDGAPLYESDFTLTRIIKND